MNKDKEKNMKVRNIAHRGARSLAPENTMAAVRRAFEEQADLWETDVRPTADGRLVLFHDEDLTRTTNVKEIFPEHEPYSGSFTFEELMGLDAGSWFAEQDPFGQIAAGTLTKEEADTYRGEKIPTLEEGLLFSRDHQWPVNLELKAQFGPQKEFPMVDRVLEAIDKTGMDTGLIRISSFHHPWLHEIREKRPEITIQALIGDEGETTLHWQDLAFKTYNAWHKLTSEEEVREMVAKGLTVNLFTVNDLKDMKRFMEAGATGIITDFPQVLREHLQGK